MYALLARSFAPSSPRFARPDCTRLSGSSRRRRPRRSASRPAQRCSTSARTTTSASRTTRGSWTPRKRALDQYGYGMSSVRFICGTLDLHKAARVGDQRSSSAPTTRSCTARASTPTAACSRPSSARRTRSSPTRSTTRRSSTESGCARRSGYRYANDDLADLEAQLRQADADGRQDQADRDRRRVLDGRRRSPISRASATSPRSTTRSCMVDDIARDRLRRQVPAAARSTTAG